MKKRLLVISDGNGVDTDFVKWPTILKILTTKSLSTVNRSVIGASNEMMLLQLTEAVKEDIDYAIIQWSIPNRIDLVGTSFWKQEAALDPVYNFNLIENNGQTWWVTSASKNAHVQQYHQKYINQWHSVLRTESYMLAAAELLKFHNIKFVFSLCYKFDFVNPYTDILNSYPWVWHVPNFGISEFREHSKYRSLDKNLSQPHPLIGLEWINQVLKPGTDFIDYDSTTYYNVEQSLLKNV
jgi:hypothetical protein